MERKGVSIGGATAAAAAVDISVSVPLSDFSSELRTRSTLLFLESKYPSSLCHCTFETFYGVFMHSKSLLRVPR